MVENRNQNSSYNSVYAIVFVGSLCLVGIGIKLGISGQGWAILATGCAGMIATLVTWPIVSSIQSAQVHQRTDQAHVLAPITDKLIQVASTLSTISNQQLISDRAKTIAYRTRDRDALRAAISEEMGRGDWEAAIALANEIDTVFGYKQEADRLRDEINEKRQEVVNQQIENSRTIIEGHIKTEQWKLAFREAEKLGKAFPHIERVLNLPREIESRRIAHKQHLQEAWTDSVTRKDIDGSIELLKKLDGYLSPTEAEAMQETARNIFREKLNNLRTQFSVAVQDHNWNEALRIGDVIVRDFPNSRVAQEVRENMVALRQRAGGEAVRA